MEKEIKQQFNDKIYKELIAAYGIDPGRIKPLGGV